MKDIPRSTVAAMKAALKDMKGVNIHPLFNQAKKIAQIHNIITTRQL